MPLQGPSKHLAQGGLSTPVWALQKCPVGHGHFWGVPIDFGTAHRFWASCVPRLPYIATQNIFDSLGPDLSCNTRVMSNKDCFCTENVAVPRLREWHPVHVDTLSLSLCAVHRAARSFPRQWDFHCRGNFLAALCTDPWSHFLRTQLGHFVLFRHVIRSNASTILKLREPTPPGTRDERMFVRAPPEPLR